MPANTFGELFRLTSFGESHGEAIGGVLDGCPAGLKIDIDFVQNELNRRKPGQSHITTARNESDQVHFLSGIFQGVSTGAPIGFIIKNQDQKSDDYSNNTNVFRPSHADYTYSMKYGIRDHRGGGRSSARETAVRVVGGAIAKLFLKHHSVSTFAYVKQIGTIATPLSSHQVNPNDIDKNIVRCPDQAVAEKMIACIEEAKQQGDSLGGIVTGSILGLPVGLGEPVFDKFHARLAYAMMGINAVKGFEYGFGFAGCSLKGSQHNDAFVSENNTIKTQTNHSGGVQGGITNGMEVYFNVGFKPTATILQEQDTVDEKGSSTKLKMNGRHDPCVLPRAVPIVEAMAALVTADFVCLSKNSKL